MLSPSACFLPLHWRGPPLLADPMWLERQEICPGVQAVSAPINLTTVPSSFSLEPPQRSVILVPQSNDSLNDVPSFLQTFHAHVVIHSTKQKVSLPFNANLGFVTSADQQEFQEAADHTADQLASSWLKFTESFLNNEFCFSSQDTVNGVCFSSGQSNQSWQLYAQTAEMTKAGLDSSILSPFLPEPYLHHPNAMPPPEGAYLDPNSDEYIQRL